MINYKNTKSKLFPFADKYTFIYIPDFTHAVEIEKMSDENEYSTIITFLNM